MGQTATFTPGIKSAFSKKDSTFDYCCVGYTDTLYAHSMMSLCIVSTLVVYTLCIHGYGRPLGIVDCSLFQYVLRRSYCQYCGELP